MAQNLRRISDPQEIFPSATAIAAAFFNGAPDNVACCLIDCPRPKDAKALRASLPANVGGRADDISQVTSVYWACGAAPRLADSADGFCKMKTFADWAAAKEAGLVTARALTAPLLAGPVVAGFVSIHFAEDSGVEDCEELWPAESEDSPQSLLQARERAARPDPTVPTHLTLIRL